MSINEIVAYVAFTVCAALMVTVILSLWFAQRRSWHRLVRDPQRKQRKEPYSIHKGPGGCYRVEFQEGDDAGGADRWTVSQLLTAKSGARAEVRRADYPTREQAVEYARGYSRSSEPELPPEHPLPNRRAAVAHTKALQ